MADLPKNPKPTNPPSSPRISQTASSPRGDVSTQPLPSSVLQSAVKACISSVSELIPQSQLSPELISVLEHTVTKVYPSLLGQFLSAFNSLHGTVKALEEKLLDAADSIKRRNREILVIKEYHKVLLKKYRLLVSKEEFEDHLNGYDKRLKIDVSTDDPIMAGKKYDKDRQEKAMAIMKVYEQREPNIVTKQTNDVSRSPIASKQEQEKKERHEPAVLASTKTALATKQSQTPKPEDPKPSKQDQPSTQKASPPSKTPNPSPDHEPVGPLREIFAVPSPNPSPTSAPPAPLPQNPSPPAHPDPRNKPSSHRVTQNPATPALPDHSGNHSEYYTIDLEHSSFRSVDDDGRPAGKKRNKDDSRLARDIFGQLPHDLSMIEPATPGGGVTAERLNRKEKRKQEQFLDANEDRDLILAAVGHKSLDNKGKGAQQPSRSQLLRKKESDTGLKGADAGAGRDGGSKSTDKQPSTGAPKLPPLNLGGGPRSFNTGLVHNIDYGRFGAAKVDGIMEKKYYQMN